MMHTVMPARCGELASLTTYFCGGVLWDHRVGGELRVQDAAVRVGVHGQAVQQLTVLLHALVEGRVRVGDQLGHRVCRATGGDTEKTFSYITSKRKP